MINLSIFLLVFSLSVFAQEECPAPTEQTALEVMELIKKTPTNFMRMEDFLQRLPKTMTSNFIFVADSRSFQTASRENPRVVLTSPDADVRITFNTDKSQRGFNNIEISFWNPKTKKFEYTELVFDPKAEKAPKAHGDTACTTCHGNPPKPNWDTYNYWSGVIPFNKDAIVKDSVEVGWYKNYLGKIKDKKEGNRLQFLTPIEDEKEIDNSLASKGYMTRQFLSENGPQLGSAGGIATNLFDKLQARQRCAEQTRMKKDKNFNKFKYLLAAMQNGCGDLEKMVPAWFHKAANDHFYGALEGFKSGDEKDKNVYKKNMSQIVNDTRNRQLGIRKDKDNRQRYFLEKELGSVEASGKEIQHQIDKVGLNAIGIAPGSFNEDIGEDSEDVANYRYFLEPFGVSVSRFSTSIDPTSYSFADTFRGDYLDAAAAAGINKEIQDKKLGGKDICEAYKDLSLEAMNAPDLMVKLLADSQESCNKKNEMNKGILDLEKIEPGLVEVQVSNILNNRCASCHQDMPSNNLDYSVGGAKVFPFRNISDLKKLMTSPQGKLVGWADKIHDRINRPHNFPGAMPLNGLVKLEDVERTFLNSWIKQFTSPGKSLE